MSHYANVIIIQKIILDEVFLTKVHSQDRLG